MGKEQDAGGGNNIDAIRHLLQKLEDAARRDVEQRQAAAPPVTPVVMPETSLLRAVDPPSSSQPLATLHRITAPVAPPALEVVPPEPAHAPIVIRAEAALPPPEPVAHRRATVLMPLAAFVLGVASAIAAVVWFDDVRRVVTQLPHDIAAVTRNAAPVPDAVKAQMEIAKPPEPPRAELPPPRPPDVSSRGEIATAPPPVPSAPLAGSPATEVPKADAPAAAEVLSRIEARNPVQTPAPPPPIRIDLPERLAVTSGERAAFPLRLAPMAQDTDHLLLVLRGVPERMILSKGSSMGGEIWMLPAHAAGALELMVSEPSLKAIRIDAELVALDGRVVSRAATSIDVSASVGDDAKREADALKLDERAMIRLGELLLDTGDLAGARAVLERAAGGGSAQAALRLGETYDPVWLPGSGLQSAAGDPASARRWYEKAKELGNAQAAERLEGLAK